MSNNKSVVFELEWPILHPDFRPEPFASVEAPSVEPFVEPSVESSNGLSTGLISIGLATGCTLQI